MIPTLETERLILRGPIVADYEPGKTFLASERTRYMGGKRDAVESWRALASMAGHWYLRGYGFFAVQIRGEEAACGLAGAHLPGTYSEIEIGWSLWRPELEGQGIAFEAATAARNWAWDNISATQRFASYIDPDNARSIRLAERLGAVRDDQATHPFGDEPCSVYRHPPRDAA